MAAELEGVVIDLDAIKEVYRQLASQHDLMLVGRGRGIIGRLEKSHQCGFNPAFRYSPDRGGPYLGPINHTLLTVEHARHSGLKS